MNIGADSDGPVAGSSTTHKAKKQKGHIQTTEDAPENMLTDTTAHHVSSKKTAEETYQKLTLNQHILKRPDTYIGSVTKTQSDMWVLDRTSQEMQRRKITYVPGLYKIFDEILVNAADN